MNCDNCGACCMEQGSPPGYITLLTSPVSQRCDWPGEGDAERITHLPAEALRAIAWYRRDLKEGRTDGDGPCCWLDRETRRCRWYEHRPAICRELDVGSEGCRVWRDEYNIDVEALK